MQLIVVICDNLNVMYNCIRHFTFQLVKMSTICCCKRWIFKSYIFPASSICPFSTFFALDNSLYLSILTKRAFSITPILSAFFSDSSASFACIAFFNRSALYKPIKTPIVISSDTASAAEIQLFAN